MKSLSKEKRTNFDLKVLTAIAEQTMSGTSKATASPDIFLILNPYITGGTTEELTHDQFLILIDKLPTLLSIIASNNVLNDKSDFNQSSITPAEGLDILDSTIHLFTSHLDETDMISKRDMDSILGAIAGEESKTKFKDMIDLIMRVGDFVNGSLSNRDEIDIRTIRNMAKLLRSATDHLAKIPSLLELAERATTSTVRSLLRDEFILATQTFNSDVKLLFRDSPNDIPLDLSDLLSDESTTSVPKEVNILFELLPLMNKNRAEATAKTIYRSEFLDLTSKFAEAAPFIFDISIIKQNDFGSKLAYYKSQKEIGMNIVKILLRNNEPKYSKILPFVIKMLKTKKKARHELHLDPNNLQKNS